MLDRQEGWTNDTVTKQVSELLFSLNRRALSGGYLSSNMVMVFLMLTLISKRVSLQGSYVDPLDQHRVHA